MVVRATHHLVASPHRAPQPMAALSRRRPSLLTPPRACHADRRRINRLHGMAQSAGRTRAQTHDAAGRMASMSINGVLQGSYKYDFAGRQAIRTIAATGVTIHSVFDAQGRRIAEYNQATGALIREYVWLGWEPIAVVQGGVVSFIRTDHIGRPVFATNTTGVKVWTASYTPFGGVRTTTGTPIDARFPGQWFQSESGLHQNWMRDYDPTTGRYLQADPLGLVDGASVYGYALQSPGMYTDPRGELVWLVPVLAGATVGMVAGYLQTGCVEGAVYGAVFGAAFGGIGHFVRAGVIASVYLGGANAGVSQVAAFAAVDGCECSKQEFDQSVFLSTVLGAGLGSGLGAAAGGYFGGALNGMAGGDVLEGIVSGGVGGLIGELGGYYGGYYGPRIRSDMR